MPPQLTILLHGQRLDQGLQSADIVNRTRFIRWVHIVYIGLRPLSSVYRLHKVLTFEVWRFNKSSDKKLTSFANRFKMTSRLCKGKKHCGENLHSLLSWVPAYSSNVSFKANINVVWRDVGSWVFGSGTRTELLS